MATAFALAALVYQGRVHIGHILALSFTAGLAQAFGGPAYQSLIPSLVDKKDLPNAIALNSIQFNLARVFGPLLAGVTMATLGTAGCFTPQRRVVPGRDRGADVALGDAHPAGRAQADARGAQGRLRLRAQRAGDPRADRARLDDDVSGAAAADVPADLRARDLPRRHRPLQLDDGVLGDGRRGRRAGHRVARALQAHGPDAARRAGGLRRADRRLRVLADLLAELRAALPAAARRC